MNKPRPPSVARRPVVKTAHGVERVDDYDWLRAENWRETLKDPVALPQAIRGHLEAENAYAQAVLAPIDALRSSLVAEMRARIKEDDAEPGAPDGPWVYFTRFRQGGEHEVVCRKPRTGDDERILIDGDALAEGKEYFDLVAAEASPDHRLMAWSADETGSEYCTVRVRDLSSGADADSVPDAEGGVVWASDSRSFYYVKLDSEHRPSRVYRHAVGTPPSADALVFEETDPGFFVHLTRTLSGAFAVIDVSDHDSSEVWLVDLRRADAQPRRVAARERQIRYDVEHRGDELFIRTNADGAEDFKIVVAPLDRPERAHWRDLTPARPGVMVVAHQVFARHLARLEREDGLPRIVVRDLTTGEEHAIAFDEEAYSLSLRRLREFDSAHIRFAYSSMTTPEEIYDYDMAARARTLVKRQEIPSGHDPALYQTRRIFAVAPDGERVPISLLHRKDAAIDGSAPLLLYGYGAYGHALPASFRSTRLSLVDRGFVFALAHVRGGTDRGRRWYLDGKLEKKTNTFSDFIAAAEHLIAKGYTRRGRIIAQGGSAGGMLMGAIANMAPDLFGGVIADVPFVDVLNTMLDADLPLTPPEWLEWGNPIANRPSYDAIAAYSPYDAVRAQPYPPILALAGLTDPRVTYWEPAKWVARLREKMTAGGPILLKTNMQAGHGGASGRFSALDDIALEYSFAYACAQGDLDP